MRALPLFAAAAVLSGMASTASAAETTASVVVSAQFNSRTTLKVSNDILQFDVARPGDPVTVSVDFSAAARTCSGAEVLLSIEQLRSVEGPVGAGDGESSVSFVGLGNGTLAGALGAARPAVAGRWSGSGLRQGRLLFALRAGASGRYTVPVRFVLSAP